MEYRKKKLKFLKSKDRFLSRDLSTSNIYFHFSPNNLIVSVSDLNGDVVTFSSAPMLGFKNNRKSTPFAMKATILDIIDKCKKLGVQKVNIIIRGQYKSINDMIKLIGNSLSILSLRETTTLAFNGTRLRSRRRV